MASFAQRLVNFLLGEDEALNALGGGEPRETISGTVGRALEAGSWWAKPVAAIIDGLLGAGHCLAQAAKEQVRRTEEGTS
jgi:hypothetical protein